MLKTLRGQRYRRHAVISITTPGRARAWRDADTAKMAEVGVCFGPCVSGAPYSAAHAPRCGRASFPGPMSLFVWPTVFLAQGLATTEVSCPLPLWRSPLSNMSRGA